MKRFIHVDLGCFSFDAKVLAAGSNPDRSCSFREAMAVDHPFRENF